MSVLAQPLFLVLLFGVGCFSQTNTIRDENNNIIYTINDSECGTNVVRTNYDCDCNRNTDESSYKTPCCGITPLQCSNNGALSDIDEYTVTTPNTNINKPKYQIPPANGNECSNISPTPIFKSTNSQCTTIPKYIALKSIGDVSMTYNAAKQMCTNLGTSIATINPYDRNFGDTSQISYLRQYIDINKLCLRNSNVQKSNFNFDSCWIGARVLQQSSQPCTVWRFVYLYFCVIWFKLLAYLFMCLYVYVAINHACTFFNSEYITYQINI